MPLSPSAVVRASWVSAKQNVGVFLLYLLFCGGVSVGASLAYSLLAMILGTSTPAMLLSGLVGLIGGLVFLGYMQLTAVRLAYLGSGGARVAFREVVAWDQAAIGRMLGLLVLYLLAYAVGYLPMLVVFGLLMAVNSSVVPLITLIGIVVYIATIVYAVSLAMATSMAVFLALKGQSPWLALKAGWAMTVGSRWRIIGYWLLLGLLFIPLALPPIVVFAMTSWAAVNGGAGVGLGAVMSFLMTIYLIVGYVLVAAMGMFGAGHLYRQLGGK